jgi:ATP-dependent DNA helicase RecG
LLFAKKTSKLSVTASFKIGRFGKRNDELLFQDIVETNIFEMPEKVMEILESKYLIRPITYQGLQRLEPLEYPKEALREAILNAIVHKDYSSTYIFLRVYDDRLHIWNPGALPEELDVEKLKGEHSSYPRNNNIANVFFKAGYIEAWGRGTNKIINACLDAGLPEPLICEEYGGVGVTFLKDIFTEDYLKTLDLNERQVKSVLFTKEKGEITNSDYQDINSIKKSVAAKELQDLTEKGLFIKVGTTGRGTKYILSGFKQ